MDGWARCHLSLLLLLAFLLPPVVLLLTLKKQRRLPMFRGALGVAGRQWRQERRLATLVDATRRSTSQRWTHRVCKASLDRRRSMRMREEERQMKRCTSAQHTQRKHLARADVEFLRRKQSESVLKDDAYAGASTKAGNATSQSRPSSSIHLDYDTVDSRSGSSIIQQRFDNLVHGALLKYGPPLPAEFVEENDVVMPHSTRNGSSTSSWSTYGEESNACQFFDEVQMKSHEMFRIIRQADPSFSVRGHADGVPFSLLVKNCLYLRVWGGKVHFMRCLRRVQTPTGGGKVTVRLSKYKMQEPPSFDGLRQGPQPHLYHYKMT